MPTDLRRHDDLRASAQPSSRARFDAPDRGQRQFAPAPANANDGYTSEELAAHANEQLRPNSAANSNALLARVRQPRQPLRANSSRVVFQRQAHGHGHGRGHAIDRSVQGPAARCDDDDDEASSDPAEPSAT